MMTTVTIVLAALAALLVIGTPIAYTLGFAGALGLLLILGVEPTLGILQTTPYRTTSNFLLATVPMFMLMAEFMARSGISHSIFQAANALVGRLRGGLAMATVLSSAVLAAISGSSTASTAAMASVALPQMRRFGYDDRLSLGTIAVAGTLSIMIPPSIPLVLYGVITETSIGRLLIAGIIPGLMTAFGYCLTIWLLVRLNPGIAPDTADSRTEGLARAVFASNGAWDGLLLSLVVIGGIYTGVMTPTEASAVGAFGAFCIALGIRRVGARPIYEAISSAARISGVIFLIVVGAMVFSYFLSASQVSSQLVTWAGGLDVSPYFLLLVILLVYLVLGFFMDQLAILFLTLPLLFPLVKTLGFDAVWFGVIVTKTVEIGLLTPPLGMNVFVASSCTGVPVEKIFRAVIPFLITELIILALLVAFPILALWLPGLMRG